MNRALNRWLRPLGTSMKLFCRVGAREAAVIGSVLGCIMAMASAVDLVWLRPLPFPDADRLVRLSESKAGDPQRYETTWGNFREWNSDRLMLVGIGAYMPADPVLSTTGEPQSFTIVRITPSLLSTLATEPIRGRSLVESDGRDGSHGVMLTDRAWTRAFGRREDVINTTIILDGVVCSVVGIAAPEVGALIRADILTPLTAPQEGRGDRIVRVVGRLRKGATPEATARALSQQVKALEVEHRENQGFNGGVVVSLGEALVGDLRRPALGLGVLAAFLLLVMGVNVLGLRLANSERRLRDMAIRKVLGASMPRLLLDAVAAAALTASVATGIGMAVWFWLLSVARQLTANSVLAERLHLRPSLVVVGACAAFIMVVAGEAYPVFLGLRRNLRAGLADGGWTSAGVPGRQRLRAGLVVMQTAVAVVFAVVAVTCVVDAWRLTNVDYGFDLADIWCMDIKTMPGREGAIASQGQELLRIMDAVVSVPGVQSVGTTNDLPFTREAGSLPLRVRDLPLPPGERVEIEIATPGYFETLRLPLRRGRTFTRADDRRGPLVVIVNQTFAKRHWPGANAVGRAVAISSSPWFTVVGVVGDIRPVVKGEDAHPKLYLSALQGAGSGQSTIVIRNRAGVAISGNEALSRVRTVNPSLAVGPLLPMSSRLAEFERPRVFAATCLVVLAMVSTMLALVGVYCLVWVTVAARQRELAIRRALGADEKRLVMTLYSRTAAMIALGAVIGLWGAFGARRVYEAVLGAAGGVPQAAGVAALISLVVLLLAAALAPVRRAVAHPIMHTLRRE